MAQFISEKVKTPKNGEIYKVEAINEDGEVFASCELEVEEGKYKVLKSSSTHQLYQSFRSHSVDSAGKFVLREKIRAYKEELGPCRNTTGVDINVYLMEKASA